MMQALYLAAGTLIGSGIIGTVKDSNSWATGTILGAAFVVLAAVLEYNARPTK